MDKLVNLNYKLPAELKADAEVMARIRGASLSEYVRNLVYADCKKNAQKIQQYRDKIKELNEE
jgi:hypothetical protein